MAGATKLFPSSCVIGQGHACLICPSHGPLYTQLSRFLLVNFTPCSFLTFSSSSPFYVSVTWLPLGPAQRKLHRWPEGAPSHWVWEAGEVDSFTATGINVAWGPPRYLLCSLGTTQPLHRVHPAKAVTWEEAIFCQAVAQKWELGPEHVTHYRSSQVQCFHWSHRDYSSSPVFRGSSVNWMFVTVDEDHEPVAWHCHTKWTCGTCSVTTQYKMKTALARLLSG